MPLVSYSSSDTESESKKSDTEPQRKRQKQSNDGLVKSAATTRDMPPLPSAFHDLYASTVRQSVVDDPKLHHGRKRQTPHIVGQWPSHIYVECESLGIIWPTIQAYPTDKFQGTRMQIKSSLFRSCLMLLKRNWGARQSFIAS